MDLRQRQERERDSGYLGFIASLPCAACLVRGVHKRGVHVSHLRAGSLEHGKRSTGGAEKPSDRPWTTPLCPHHHVNGNKESQHYYPGGEEAFWEDLGINPFELCLELDRAYERSLTPALATANGRVVIARFAAKGRAAIEARAAA